MRYFIFRDGGVSGPFEEEVLRKAFASGEIPGDTQVSNEGEEVWRPLAVAFGEPAASSLMPPSPPRAASDEKYWGFISYSHQDKAVGTWLHKKLEGYRIPSALVGRLARNGVIPDRLFPIFRDREELPTSSNLSVSIQEALAASRYLIVICSPRSAASHWVNAEIRAFDAMGKRNRILALILEGEPHATEKKPVAADDCFPPALRFVPSANDPESTKIFEPIASDLRPGGDSPERALLKIVAGLIGVNFDDLFQRERRRKRKRQMFGYILLAFGLFLTVGLFLWNSRLQKRQESVATELETMKQQGPYKEIGKLPLDRQRRLQQTVHDLAVDELLSRSKQLVMPSRLKNQETDIKNVVTTFKNQRFETLEQLKTGFQDAAVRCEQHVFIPGHSEVKSTLKQLEDKATNSYRTLENFAQNFEEKLLAKSIAEDISANLWDEIGRLQDLDAVFRSSPSFAVSSALDLIGHLAYKCYALQDQARTRSEQLTEQIHLKEREIEEKIDKVNSETNPPELKNAQAQSLKAEKEQLKKQREANEDDLRAFKKKIEKMEEELRAQFQAKLNAAEMNDIQGIK